ncbi:hypothetical protein [Segetibacter koreensis]|uniref:hypothetical protein n=1 Tax=Segetibacter koreensis TaxID=398037 RepID=UPI0003739651|nr:hypothetical protein [Segetibacter koreensis]
MTTIIVPFSKNLNSRIKRLWNITKLAKRRSFDISNKEEVGGNVIALDVAKRKLLYAKITPHTSSCLIINLNNLEKCTIKKEYHSINAGELKTKKLHQFLKSIFLHFVFKNGSGTLSLPFFDARKEQQVNIEQLEAKAKKWETIVSKVLPIQIRDSIKIV